MTAHSANLGIVHQTPKDWKRSSNKPGANKRMFILTLTARLMKAKKMKTLKII